MKSEIDVREEDLIGEDIKELLTVHVADMHESSPAGMAYVLDLSALKAPGFTFWSARQNGALLGFGALKELDPFTGEIKSMRTHPDHLRKGVGARLLDHIIETGRTRGYRRLSLETGTGPKFEAALGLYRKRGFANGPGFGGYRESDFNQFLHLDL